MHTRREALALPLAALAAGYRLPLALADDADPTRVFPAGKKPTDARLGPPKTLNGYFPFAVPKTKEAWEARRKELHEQLLLANGLWPMPEKTPLNPVIRGRVGGDGYWIEKVHFASTPGHYVCGNLYTPSIRYSNPSPAVLFAHGHWAGGRFHDEGEKAAAAAVKAGGEATVEQARFFMQAIPITLARLGFVVFQYDMVGYADSTAIPHREGFKDTAAELRLQSQMGLQTWNSIRALDFVASLPGVDAKRIGMTGASGGGTQTFMLAALDDRLAAAFPAVMVSTAMQGGCVCENCSYLRVNTGNVEIAGMFAPKPMALSAANDWTKDLMTKGYPELKELYKLYGAEDKVAAKAWLEYGHQYNRHAREFMYTWFVKHLKGKDEAVKEEAFTPTPVKDLSVFDAEHPRPKDELTAEKLREAMTKASDDQMAKLTPKDAESLKEFRRVVGTALRVMVGSGMPTKPDRQIWPRNILLDGGYTGLLSASGRDGSNVPSLAVWGRGSNNIPVMWVHPRGKASLLADGKLVPAAKAIVDAGYLICAPDVLGVGELTIEKPRPVDKGYAGYTFGYNSPLLASRVQDVLTVLAEKKSVQGKTAHIIGWGEFGPVAVLAKAIAGDAVTKLAADLNQFRFENIKDTADPMMLPGAVKYGGLPAFLALCAPSEVLAHNTAGTATGRLPKAAYDAAGAADKLTHSHDKWDDLKVVEWLVR